MRLPGASAVTAAAHRARHQKITKRYRLRASAGFQAASNRSPRAVGIEMSKSILVFLAMKQLALPRWRRHSSLYPPPFTDKKIGQATSDKIRHVVVLTMSSHSYDNMLGALTGKGDGLPVDKTGRHAGVVSRRDGSKVMSHHLPSTVQLYRTPVDSWEANHIQAGCGSNEGFATSVEMLVPGADSSQPMGYWTEQDLPFWHQLARTFPIADRWFASCLGPGLPNRRFLIAGTANGLTENAIRFYKKPASGTIFDQLSRNKISWSIYNPNKRIESSGENLSLTHQLLYLLRVFAALLSRYILQSRRSYLLLLLSSLKMVSTADLYRMNSFTRSRHVESIEIFKDQASRGKLPSVSFVDPDFLDNSGEKPQDVRFAEAYVAQIVQAIMHGKGWKETVLIILHDCHGGYYDHVPPPSAIEPEDLGTQKSLEKDLLRFDRLGFRVPAVIVSPYAKRNYTSHTQYDHTSILKLIQILWNLPPLTRRDAAAEAPLDALDLDSAPEFLSPPSLCSPAAGKSFSSSNGLNPFKAETFTGLLFRLLLIATYSAAGYFALLSQNVVIEVIAAYTLTLLTARLVIETGFWRRWAFWLVGPPISRRTAVYRIVTALTVLTVLFALFMSGFYRLGLFKSEPKITDPIPMRILDVLSWNLVDAIPGLRITDTFAWKPPFVFLDTGGRLILVLYRLLVLGPVIAFLADIIRPESSVNGNSRSDD